MDASVRVKTASLTPVLQRARRLGVFAAVNNYMLPMHVHPAMLTYFGAEPCLLAPFHETAGGFVVLKNELLVQLAVLDPWVACAFSPRCLCPSEAGGGDCGSLLACRMRGGRYPYFRCHRFDQSALGVILAVLFDRRATALGHELTGDEVAWFKFRRDDRVQYLPPA